jgi:hypothetical protein
MTRTPRGRPQYNGGRTFAQVLRLARSSFHSVAFHRKRYSRGRAIPRWAARSLTYSTSSERSGPDAKGGSHPSASTAAM